MIILGYVVFAEQEVDLTDHWKYVVHFLLRLSIALFVEVFAYFFLRLYKTSLEDTKFYQNEITNIESKLAALKAASEGEGDKQNAPLMKIAIEALAKRSAISC